jgi:hypothetical protein
MSSKRLSPIQRKILKAMVETESTVFSSHGARKFGFSIHGTKSRTMVRCYGTPEYFLHARGLIEPMQFDDHCYRITAKGREAIGHVR